MPKFRTSGICGRCWTRTSDFRLIRTVLLPTELIALSEHLPCVDSSISTTTCLSCSLQHDAIFDTAPRASAGIASASFSMGSPPKTYTRLGGNQVPPIEVAASMGAYPRMWSAIVPPENYDISTHGLKDRCSSSELWRQRWTHVFS